MRYSHMQETLKYVADSERIVGYLMDHAPWSTTDGGKTEQSCRKTNYCWKKEFDSDISIDHLYNTIEMLFDNLHDDDDY
ncbi:unnamed protein product [Didymodactylos carnosus]|uniref:Uncharacterized protein n=1 Tax=Didymodactylos carnosus TaxID=1234261 RepID=A0A814QJF0_9BILA|nr:unnamed protein product [Didymodactylos carnosus]CAF1335685.1 unnamed protein product [Didymodactylos carnosus]CAF3884118.1 unnamed protein product [Didymodactylos carnosus]CAF4147013.1 unnamed protein product [Didymodactylos carnosus]